MKTLFLILSFSFCLSYANAQKFVVEKDSLLGMYYVKSEKHDSLLQAYKALGPETDCKTGNRAAYSNYVQRFMCTLLNQDIMDKLKKIDAAINIHYYFNKNGEFIDAVFFVDKIVLETLTMEDFQYVYQQCKKQRIDMRHLVWSGDFTYAWISLYWYVPIRLR